MKRFKRPCKDTEPVWSMMELPELILVLPLEIYVHIYSSKYKNQIYKSKKPWDEFCTNSCSVIHLSMAGCKSASAGI